VRSRSRTELRQRLRQAGFEQEEIEGALVDLEQMGLVDDERFAREFVRDRVTTRLAGRRAIKAALRQKGVGADVADLALTEAGDDAENAAELAARKAARLVNLPPEVAYRRLYSLLLRRGYGHGVAVRACSEALSAALRPPNDD
jgi:regulatory protein